MEEARQRQIPLTSLPLKAMASVSLVVDRTLGSCHGRLVCTMLYKGPKAFTNFSLC